MNFWLHKILLLDSLSYLTFGRLASSLERFILIDIDDVFVGPTGIRMGPEDVKVCTELRIGSKSFFHGDLINESNIYDRSLLLLKIVFRRKYLTFDLILGSVENISSMEILKKMKVTS